MEGSGRLTAIGLTVVALLLLGGTTTVSAASVAPAPPGFFGVVPQATPSAEDLTRLKGVVGTMRIPINWSESEPTPGHYEFAALDALIGAAADHGLRVQPFVSGTPSWLSPEQARPPLSPRASAAWTEFLHVLVKRYGTKGEFWRGRAQSKPIQLWQVWNEPNFLIFWRPRPSPAGYARLLHVSARAIRRADPKAQIALAGVAPVTAGVETWEFLRSLFRIPGVSRDFDVAAIHPYSSTLLGVVDQVRRVRGAMVQAGLRSRPLLVSEIGVASQSDIRSTFVKGPTGQAAFLRTVFGRLLEMRQRWNIGGVDWFTLRDSTESNAYCTFCQGAGLFDVVGQPKPAWGALRQLAAAGRRH
jgi:hypothetical protein